MHAERQTVKAFPDRSRTCSCVCSALGKWVFANTASATPMCDRSKVESPCRQIECIKRAAYELLARYGSSQMAQFYTTVTHAHAPISFAMRVGGMEESSGISMSS